MGDPPKTLWRFEFPNEIERMELTVHDSEITKEFLLRIANLFSFPEDAQSWDIFGADKSYPSYAWSKKAEEHSAKRRKITEERRTNS